MIHMEPIRLSLAAARVNADLTQKEAAQKLQISVSTLRSYEVGNHSPNWNVAKRMSELYGIPIDFLKLP